MSMTRSFEEWWSTIPSDLKEKASKDDEANKTIIKPSQLCSSTSTASRQT